MASYNKKVVPSLSMKMILLLLGTFFCKGCGQSNTLKTVEKLELDKYQGVWYEIARKPFRPEKNLKNITAEYILKENGKIEVINQGYTSKGKIKRTTGKAFRPDSTSPGKLKVKFFGIFAASYWVVDMDTINYQYAVISGPSGKYLWILCRKPQMDKPTLERLIENARLQGLDVSDLIKTKQEW